MKKTELATFHETKCKNNCLIKTATLILLYRKNIEGVTSDRVV